MRNAIGSSPRRLVKTAAIASQALLTTRIVAGLVISRGAVTGRRVVGGRRRRHAITRRRPVRAARLAWRAHGRRCGADNRSDRDQGPERREGDVGGIGFRPGKRRQRQCNGDNRRHRRPLAVHPTNSPGNPTLSRNGNWQPTAKPAKTAASTLASMPPAPRRPAESARLSIGLVVTRCVVSWLIIPGWVITCRGRIV